MRLPAADGRMPAMIGGSLSFVRYLEEQLHSSPPKQKGQRTRERLKIATARVLEKKGYLAMRAADITRSARLSEGSFYIYFRDKTDATLAVLTALLEDFFLRKLSVGEGESPFEAIRRANRDWLALARANSGLMRCLLQLGDENPDFSTVVNRTNRIWRERIAKSIARRQTAIGGAPVLFAVYLLSAMMDELVRKLIVYPDPDLLELLKDLGADDEVIADAASVLWLRALYPKEALPADLPAAAESVARVLGVPIETSSSLES